MLGILSSGIQHIWHLTPIFQSISRASTPSDCSIERFPLKMKTNEVEITHSSCLQHLSAQFAFKFRLKMHSSPLSTKYEDKYRSFHNFLCFRQIGCICIVTYIRQLKLTPNWQKMECRPVRKYLSSESQPLKDGRNRTVKTIFRTNLGKDPRYNYKEGRTPRVPVTPGDPWTRTTSFQQRFQGWSLSFSSQL